MVPGWGSLVDCWDRDLREAGSENSFNNGTKSLPALHALHLQINPPYPADAQDRPEPCLPRERADGEPVEDEQICSGDGDEQWQADQEDEEAREGLEGGGLGAQREERRNLRP